MSKYLYAKHLYWLLVLAGVHPELAVAYVRHIVRQVTPWHWMEIEGLELIQAFHQARVYMRFWHDSTGIYRNRRGKRCTTR